MRPMYLRSVLFASLVPIFCLPAFAQTVVPNSRVERDNDASVVRADTAASTAILRGGTLSLQAGTWSVGKDGGLLVLSFHGEPSDADLAAIAANGVLLHDYLGAGAYWASVPAGIDVQKLGFLKAAVRPAAELKMGSGLQRRIASVAADAPQALILMLVPGVSRQQLATSFPAGGIDWSNARPLAGGQLGLTAPAGSVRALADSDLVLAVESADWRRRPLNADTSSQIGATAARMKYGLSGAGVNVGIWDGGPVFKHKELTGRLTVVQSKEAVDSHATHVAGTIAASGINAAAKGMAPQAYLYSYDFNGDIVGEMANAVSAYGIVLSNNSWGYANGWEDEGERYNGHYVATWYGDEEFGRYTSEASAFDAMIIKSKLTVVFAAGNDRGDYNFSDYYYDYWEDRFFPSGNKKGLQDGPYLIVGPPGTAKNVLTVGATNGPAAMASFSSWGPTLDGRIKPEISAPGVGIFSCVKKNRYAVYSGTSMATPAVTGSLALIVEAWRSIFNHSLSPDLLRALVVATATDVQSPGPDYSYGYGVIDVAAAADLVAANAAHDRAFTGKAHKGKTVSYALTMPAGLKTVRICLAWLDPAGASLVNDLDLSLIAPNGTRYRPWILDPAAPTGAAVRGVNSRDPLELVEIDNPAAGTWKLEIAAARMGKGNRQLFAVAINGK